MALRPRLVGAKMAGVTVRDMKILLPSIHELPGECLGVHKVRDNRGLTSGGR